MGFFKKHIVQIIIVATILTFLFFITRFFHILSLPIFTDEAIYLRWAQIAKNDASWRFISLTDGKQPSFVWFTIIAMRFIQDPLLAGRAVSVFAGFFSAIGLFFLTKELFKNVKVAFITTIPYLIYPMALVYDRMALYDSLVATFSIWSLFLTVLLVRKIRLDVALLLGLVAGGAMLTKTNGFFAIYLLPFSLLLFDWQRKGLYVRLAKWIGLAIVAILLANASYAILRLSPFFYIISEKTALFAYPLSEWIKHPFTYFVGNWSAQWNWLMLYMTPPVLILVVLSFFEKAYLRVKLMLLIWFFIPFTYLAFFGNTIYPRFILFMTVSLLPLVGLSLWILRRWIKNPIFFVLCFLLLVAMQLSADYYILSDFAKAPIPVSDLGQYYTGWPSGVGVKESIAFFKEKAKVGKIYIGTQGTFGLMPTAYEIYLLSNPNITLEGYWPTTESEPQKLLEISKTIPSYFVFYQPCPACNNKKGIAPSGWENSTQVYQAQKVEKDSFLTVYQIQPNK